MLATYTTPRSGTGLASAGVPRAASSLTTRRSYYCLPCLEPRHAAVARGFHEGGKDRSPWIDHRPVLDPGSRQG